MVRAMRLVWFTLLTLAVNLSAQAQPLDTVAAAFKDPGSEWKDYPTRTLENLPAAVRDKVDSGLTSYGGLGAAKSEATGFFHTKKLDGRWWLVDPAGGLDLYKGIASVGPLRTSGAKAPFRAKFGGIGFLTYCAALAGYAFSSAKAKSLLRKNRPFLAGFLVAASVVSLCVFVANDSRSALVASPAGAGKGIFPGRVAWVYNPNAAKWTGVGNYWDASVNPQAEYNKSFTAGIAALSGATNDADSWDKIFHWFNNSHGRPGTGYQAGDIIAIKINQNNSPVPAADHGNQMNSNPQTSVAVLTSLVNAGIPQTDIWIGDPSRAVTDNVFNAIHNAFPKVSVVDYYGNNGRFTTGVTNGVFPNTDVKNAEAMCFYNARYIVNTPLLKGHVGQMITFGAKNLYGLNGILPHWQENKKHPHDSALTAYMTNANFGGKVVLWCMDAMYPSLELDGAPYNGVALAPFNGKQMSSFIMSLDGVAEECVSYDFWSTISGQSGGTDYMYIAANAGAGVADHWNNSTDKKYTKNLDPNANGIELVPVTPQP